MTEPEFSEQFIAKLGTRFPFYRTSITEEVKITLWSCFGQFPIDIAMDAIHTYAIQDPDLNMRTFKLKALMAICFDEMSKEQVKFEWYGCDEAAFYAHSHFCRKQGLPEPTIDEFALHTLGKSQVPTESDREKARSILKGHGVTRTYGEIERVQSENERQYTHYRMVAESARFKKAAKLPDAKPEDAGISKLGSFTLRGRKLVERIATEG